MKYIIVRNVATGGLDAILFSELVGHAAVASTFNVVSAGFCRLQAPEPSSWQYDSDGFLLYEGEAQAVVYGESVGLGLKSQPDDAAIINDSIRRRI